MKFKIKECYTDILLGNVIELKKYSECIVLDWNGFILTFEIRKLIKDGYYYIYYNAKNHPYDDYETYKNTSDFVLTFNIYTSVYYNHLQNNNNDGPDEVLNLQCSNDEYFEYLLNHEIHYEYEDLPLFSEMYLKVKEIYFK